MKYIILFISLFFSFAKANAQSIIPKPNSIKEFYKLRFNFSKINIVCSQELETEASYLKSALEEKNVPVFINSKVSSTQNIVLNIDNEKIDHQESYKLSSNQEIMIEAKTSTGIFYGIQSLLQLIGTQKNNFSLYETEIEDAPKFSWRGMHLDVSRHYFPVSFIKKYIDILALHKMNTFHWHLTDDQGWRIEIKKYPLLTEVGSKRHETIVDKNFEPFIGDGKAVEGFYTQDQIKEIIKYAAERHINIVPEIEMPGHCVAAISAYPFLGCLGKNDEVMTKWGVSDNVLCTKDSTLKFMYDVLDEVMNLFPSKIIHIGGDEVPKSQWKKCNVCQQKIKELKLKDEHELQSYFIKKIDSFVVSKGKNIIGWDEILEGGLAKNAKVMSWRGEEGGIEAANQNHDVVMCPGSHCYFDHYQGNKKTEPLAIGGYTTVKKVYSYQPIPEKLN
ncbi:MAG: beta-N-acetylhexosaminidase [Chitinophagaceae bacterium]|nr:beta-N-acetylhexosaminidase [Chitinophagaceae bacterium]